jgi:mevalonate kinase
MTTAVHTYRASCKLMLFGEYFVLRGSKSLAFPLKFGQALEVLESTSLSWTGISPQGVWFEAKFDDKLNIIDASNTETAEILKGIFLKIKELNPRVNLNQKFTATADFMLEWGLGSSSTLLSLLSQWAGVNPYDLLESSFGGSGYDIACATAEGPILYEIKERNTENVELDELITNNFLFVYLGKKQSSRQEIARFEKNEIGDSDVILLNEIISKALESKTIEEFESCLNSSEDLLTQFIGKAKLKEAIFADYKYSIKSLGAWGGDFFLATYRDIEEAKSYFSNKGYDTMFTYKELIK